MKPDYTRRRALNALVRNSFLPGVIVGSLLTAGTALANGDDDERLAWSDARIDEINTYLAQPNGSESEFSTRDFGEKNTWRWALIGAAAFEMGGDASQYSGHAAFNYFLAKDFGVVFEFGGFYFDEPTTGMSSDTGGANVNALLRWHFHENDERTWSIFGEVGVGVLLAGHEIPAGGSETSLTPQAGLGASFQLGDSSNRILTGVRWHHMSNANLASSDNNPGRDSAMFYLGIDFPLR